jgi:hypothetical protein
VRFISDDPAFRTPGTGAAGTACRDCGIADPPPGQSRTAGGDHFVGTTDGCPNCGRPKEACVARPCSAARAGKAAVSGGPPSGPDILDDLEFPGELP